MMRMPKVFQRLDADSLRISLPVVDGTWIVDMRVLTILAILVVRPVKTLCKL